MTATTTQDRTPSILDGLIEAAQAIHDLPKVRDELAFAKLEAEDLRHSLDGARTEAEAQAKRIAELEAAVASKEAALSDATFRNEALQGAINVIRDALPVQRRVVEPVPEPALDVTPEAGTEATAPFGQSPEALSTSPTPAPTTPGDASEHTAEQPSAVQSSGIGHDHAQSPEAMTEAHPGPFEPHTPTESFGTTTAQSGSVTTMPSLPSANDHSHAQSPEPKVMAPAAAEDRDSGNVLAGQSSGTQPMAGSTVSPSQHAPADTAPSSASATSQPSHLRPANTKPSWMSWGQWATNGGEVPHWVTDLNVA